MLAAGGILVFSIHWSGLHFQLPAQQQLSVLTMKTSSYSVTFSNE